MSTFLQRFEAFDRAMKNTLATEMAVTWARLSGSDPIALAEAADREMFDMQLKCLGADEEERARWEAEVKATVFVTGEELREARRRVLMRVAQGEAAPLELGPGIEEVRDSD